jgi:hypothetical protein
MHKEIAMRGFANNGCVGSLCALKNRYTLVALLCRGLQVGNMKLDAVEHLCIFHD